MQNQTQENDALSQKLILTKYSSKYTSKTRNHYENTLICELCPNNCIILDHKYGRCNARINIKGKLYSTTYGHPCSINIDPIEKKPLYHYNPGSKVLSFGTIGCNMFCLGCQNFDISRADPPILDEFSGKKTYSPQEIVDMTLKYNIKQIAYTYNEPTVFFEYMIDIAKIAKSKGIKNILVSNGYINPKPLKELSKYIDAANIDLKGISDKFYLNYSKVRIKPVLYTIKFLKKKGIWIELTNLLIPELNDSKEDIIQLCKWIKNNLGENVPLHFSRFYPMYKATNLLPTSSKKMYEAKELAEKIGIKYVYIGNLGFLGDTNCINCKSVLIERTSGQVSPIGLKGKNNNRCKNCNKILPGKFFLI